MGVLDALATLPVPPVPSPEMADGTAKPQQPQRGSAGSVGSAAKPRAPEPEPTAYPCTECDNPDVRRQRRAVEMCRRLAVAIGREAPAGLGHWEEAWERVNAPSAAFLDALKQWEQTGAEEAKTEVQRTAEAVLLAWREAARQWEHAGRPAGRAP